MKDVVTCDKPWEDGSSHYTQGSPNGETQLGQTQLLPVECIDRVERYPLK